MGLEVGIWASRLGFGPQGWDKGLQAEMWAWRLGGRGWAEEDKEEKEEEEEEKIPHMCESKVIDPIRAAALLPPQLQPRPT